MTAEAAASERPPRKKGERTLLPFRVESGTMNGYPSAVLHWESAVFMPDGSKRTIPMSRALGVHSSDDRTAVADHLGEAVLALMKQFWALEKDYDYLAAALEKIEGEIARLEHENASLRGKVDYLQRGGNGSRGGQKK